MIDANRVKELRGWVAKEEHWVTVIAANSRMDSRERGQTKDLYTVAQKYTDLLSILADYEATMPLIEAAMKARFRSIPKRPNLGERDDWIVAEPPTEQDILRAAFDLWEKFKERGERP